MNNSTWSKMTMVRFEKEPFNYAIPTLIKNNVIILK